MEVGTSASKLWIKQLVDDVRSVTRVEDPTSRLVQSGLGTSWTYT